ncbi:hypothetical protein CHARACLAT_029455 [Characodon lateralis]|uniref:Uncharacterized protein n=1 Tax=Characodon lateralis TaxID=208331 RepID=A0ABU7DDD9_9TELE|nr:hypothetical protein [Characodon lateralis]
MFLSDHSVRISKNSSSSPRWLIMSLRIPLTQQSRTYMLTRDVPSNTADAITPFQALKSFMPGLLPRGRLQTVVVGGLGATAEIQQGEGNFGKFSVYPLSASDSCNREREREQREKKEGLFSPSVLSNVA